MAREINTTQPYTDKLLKLIPTEIVGTYMVLLSILTAIPTADTNSSTQNSLEKTSVARTSQIIAGDIPKHAEHKGPHGPAKLTTNNVAANDTVRDSADPMSTKEILMQVVFFVLLAMTPVYLRRVSKVTNVPQLALSTLSFAAWVYTLGGPFVTWNAYDPTVASVVLILWSLITPLFVSGTVSKR